MDPTGVRDDTGKEWCAAVDLAHQVAAGHELPNIPSPALLDPGELLHAHLTADGWRFHDVDVTYASPHAVAIGSPLMFGIVAASSAARRHRVRREAEALAAPQWRPLGTLRILATDRRLVVWHEDAWSSVWYHVIRELRPALNVGRLDMKFDDDPPYCLAGPWVPYLTLIVTTVLAQGRGVDAVMDALRMPVNG